MQSVKKIGSIKNKTVILRADFNVPIENGVVTDTFRIDSTLATIDLLIKKGAKIVIFSHLGEDGKKSLMPVAKYLAKKKYKGYFEESDNTEVIRDSVMDLCSGEILLVENIRRFEGEKTDDKKFSVFLASLGDYYVNDAFSVSHRKHASIVGVAKYLPSFAGLQLETEIKMLSKALKPKKPFLFILGGAKFDTKLPLLKKYTEIADAVFVGGALANTLLKKKGYVVGTSLAEDNVKISNPLLKNSKLLLPMDVTVLRKKKLEVVSIEEIEETDNIVDIGTETLLRIKPLIDKAKLIVWNGPLSKSGFSDDVGTIELLKLLKSAKGETIIGGGDTAEIVHKMKMQKEFTFVSTGGGAALDFLANGTLPGIKALK
jgi:phosphoglycerate kinase